MKQRLLALTLAVAFLAVSVVSVRADQYGEVHGTTAEAPREEITHGTVQAGLGDNLWVLALIISGEALGLILIAKLTRRVYLLD